MEEREVFFGRGTVRIEGLHADAGGTMGAVISHPHPLMGGDMGNPVVEILSEVFFASGISTLRFNLRGVGRSTGAFDGGQGEQADVLAAVDFLKENGTREILLAGYSFGAWINAGVLTRGTFLPALLVAPPLTLLKFDFQAIRGKVGAIVCGDMDSYCPLEKATAVAEELSCRLDLIPGADHFFTGREEELTRSVKTFATQRVSIGNVPQK